MASVRRRGTGGLLVTLCLLMGCSPDLPDRRRGDVVVGDVRLRDLVAEALDWWNEASGGQVSMTLADRCAPGRSCVEIRTGVVHEGGEDPLGSTSRWEDSLGNAGAWVTIASAPEDPISKIVVAHELGHAIELGHVQGSSELMRQNGEAPACTGPETSAQYRAVYGEELRRVCR